MYRDILTFIIGALVMLLITTIAGLGWKPIPLTPLYHHHIECSGICP